jgi:hypothetical protein
MEPNPDPQLRKLLREWEVMGAPPAIEEKIFGRSRAWWRFLLTGSIRVPVPVGLAVALAVVLLAIYSIRERRPAAVPAAAPGTVSLTDFRPVDDVQVRVIRSGYENR